MCVLKVALPVVFSILSLASYAQCLSGNCKNGQGKIDLGYAVYTGEFKDGKPDGTGTIDYGGGEKYTGQFSKGAENGRGVLYHKNNTVEEVEFDSGHILRKQKVITVGGNTYVDGCKAGDCIDGYSEIDFPSGNKYAGNMREGKMHGNGKFYFASGNVFEGAFNSNEPVEGTFIYSREKISFIGTMYPDCSPKTGTYHYEYNGSSVEVRDNVIVKVINPRAEEQDAAAAAAANKTYVKCPVCQGKGITGSASTYSYTTPGTYTISQFGQGRINLTNPETHTSTGRTFYNVCSKCKGEGKIAE